MWQKNMLPCSNWKRYNLQSPERTFLRICVPDNIHVRLLLWVPVLGSIFCDAKDPLHCKVTSSGDVPLNHIFVCPYTCAGLTCQATPNLDCCTNVGGLALLLKCFNYIFLEILVDTPLAAIRANVLEPQGIGMLFRKSFTRIAQVDIELPHKPEKSRRLCPTVKALCEQQ